MEEVSLTAAVTIVIMFVAMANLLGRVCLVKKEPNEKQSAARQQNYSLMSDDEN